MDILNGFYCFRIGAVTRRIWKYVNSEYGKYGITVGQTFILFDLLDHDGSPVKDIAERVQVESPAVTGFVDRLIREGLVKRSTDQTDRRVMKIHLTPKGRELAVTLLPVAQTLNRKIEELVGEKEIKKLLQILDIIEETV
ncbi:MAG TPA: MarR family winged helix-turn-helix transcriptional regulator [Deltaproteobacteria bacterium]|nr:MarR family winged helix-turn-helix transcriptional regulator [Deltaproteobacteria bacterium]HPJ94158.1 MarR family winged helix-turn-helix transcriptional regulator [Deltaproteobacteria bacterium]HPR50567.1 MarR family winged helix-turn-helix transcriptional regulator [Deltaproteobacteria bacterium]